MHCVMQTDHDQDGRLPDWDMLLEVHYDRLLIRHSELNCKGYTFRTNIRVEIARCMSRLTD